MKLAVYKKRFWTPFYQQKRIEADCPKSGFNKKCDIERSRVSAKVLDLVRKRKIDKKQVGSSGI